MSRGNRFAFPLRFLLGAVLWPGMGGAVAALDLNGGRALEVRHELLYYNNKVTGAGASGSFLTPGTHYSDDLGLSFTLPRGSTRWEGALDGRFTDDPRIDSREASLKRLYLKQDAGRLSWALGDHFASFSPYALDASLKGGRLAWKLGGTEVALEAGSAKPSWDDVFRDNRTETVDRTVYGARASRRFQGDALIGASLVETRDARSRFNASSTTSDQDLAALDWALPMVGRLRVQGESSYSRTRTSSPASGADTASGWAHRVKADASTRLARTQNEFERVSPDFATTVGAAARDLVRFRSQNRLRVGGAWRLLGNFSWFHNNLDGSLPGTTRTVLPEAGIGYESPSWRPNFLVELKARRRSVEASASGTRTDTDSLLASAADRIGPASVNLDYELQTEKRSDGTVDGRHHTLGIGLTSLHRWGDWKLRPAVRWNLQRDRDDVLSAGGGADAWNLQFALESPWGLDAGAGWSRNITDNLAAPGADKQSWTASLGYNILGFREHRLELRFRRNDNEFGSPGQDFDETVWEISLVNRF